MDFEKYKTTAPYPDKADFTTMYVYKNGKVIWKGPKSDSTWAPSGVKEYVFDEEGYKKVRTVYYKNQSDMNTLFVKDLFEEFGVTNNPKANKCYAIVYEHGHSSGNEEIYYWFMELVDLIK